MSRHALTLEVDAIVGSDIRTVMLDMLRLSRKLGVMTTMKFNDVHLYVAANDNIEDLMARWHSALERHLPSLPVRVTPGTLEGVAL